MCSMLTGVVSTRSSIFPLIWVGCITCWVKLQSKINSQKVFEDREEPIKEDQLMAGKLKSPTKIHLLEQEIRLVKYRTEDDIWHAGESGGIWTEHKTKSWSTPILTETTSMSGGDGRREVSTCDLTAMSTPPPRDGLSLRNHLKKSHHHWHDQITKFQLNKKW